MASSEIDAVAELDKVDNLGRSTLGEHKKRLPPGAKAMLIIALMIGLLASTLFGLKAYRISQAAAAQSSGEADNAQAPRIGTGGREFQPARLREDAAPETVPVPAEQMAMAAQGQPISPTAYATPSPARSSATTPGGKVEKSPEEQLFDRRLNSGLVGKEQGKEQSGQPSQATAQGGASGSGALAEQMQPVRFNPASASLLANRDLLLTQGAMLDCQLETKIVSTQAGQVSCYTTRDVYSTSGRVVLLERGSKIVGQYQGGMTQGQARIFVLWTRAETNKGVIINLDSTGTGPLGEAGLGGWVDTHFWERFGGAILLSVIDDIGNFVSRQGSSSDSDRITFDNTSDSAQDMAAEALSNTINIPPTLYKNQGERVQIFVARDLDFSGVYSLERN